MNLNPRVIVSLSAASLSACLLSSLSAVALDDPELAITSHPSSAASYSPRAIYDRESATAPEAVDSMDSQATTAGGLVNLIGDGSFELDDGSWTLTGTAFNPRCTVFTCGPNLATDGFVYLWLGGGLFDNGNGGVAAQTLVIPADAGDLTFDWISGSNDPVNDCESPADDRLELLIDGDLVWRSPDPCIRQEPAATVALDMAALGYADDQSHTITFQAFNVDAAPGSGILTNFFLDNVTLTTTLVDTDTDADGVFDGTDNCTTVPNSDQIDTNGDGIGNACDADINNDCIVNFQDIALFPPAFNSAPGDANYNENLNLNTGNDAINFLDFVVFTNYFNQPPGPSANVCVPGLGT